MSALLTGRYYAGRTARTDALALTKYLFRSHVPNCSKYNSRFCPDAQCLIDEQGFRGSINFAKPKSRILTWPSLVMKRFSGFRSR